MNVTFSGPFVAAVPARNEAGRIGSCLDALNTQLGARLDHIVLLVNNSTDATAAAARGVRMHPSTTLHVVERTLPPGQANAGHARRLAMEAAAVLAGPRGVLLTTDADGQVDPDWLAANLAALGAGAEMVAGWVELDPIEWGRIPMRLHQDDARECAYDALLDEIHARLDPDPADPAPRHTQHSGASLAMTAGAYARSGGVPAIRCGEDRALVAAFRRVDAPVRHAPEVHVTVSGRLDGRSQGGMADTIRRRLSRPDPFLDDRLEPAADCARRAWCRAELRRAYDDRAFDITALSNCLQLPRPTVAQSIGSRHFGTAWEAVEMAAPALRRRPVAAAEIRTQILAAQAILATLPPSRPAGRSGTQVREPEGRDAVRMPR